MDDPHYSYADMCTAVGDFTKRTVMRSVERSPFKTPSGDNVIAREYVYPENGDQQMVYFVRVEGAHSASVSALEATRQQDIVPATELSRDDECVQSSERRGGGKQGEVSEGGGDSWRLQWTGGERGEAEAMDGREEGGAVSRGIEAECPWEDSSDGDYDSNDDNGYRNTFFTVSDSSGSDGDSNSDELPDSKESSRVCRSGAHSLTDGNVYALESDDSGSSWREAATIS